MGWLHASPKIKGQKDKEINLGARVKSLPDDSVYFQMPDLMGAEYIAQSFSELGACKSNGMGRVPLDWLDVASYAQFTSLNKWEANQIISMSRIYTNAVETLTSPASNPPYCADEDLALQQQREMLRQKRQARMKAAS